jgi:hypothetical protein
VPGFDAAPVHLAWFTHGDGAKIPIGWWPFIIIVICYICDSRVVTEFLYVHIETCKLHGMYTACTRRVHVHMRALEVAVYTVHTCIT